MARSGDFSTSNPYIVFWIEAIQNSPNIGNNTSNVTVRVWVKRTNTGYTTYGSGTVYLKINGSSYSASISSNDTITSTPRKLIERNVTISHNVDGTKTLSMSARITHAVFSGSEQSWSMTLTTIPRKSTFSLSNENVKIGETINISINRAASNFTHRVTWSFGNTSGEIAANASTSASWTLPYSLGFQIPNSLTGSGYIYVYTYYNGTHIGTTEKKITVTVADDMRPYFPELRHSEAVSNVDTKIGAYVQGQTRINFEIYGAYGSYGSTIEFYRVYLEDGYYTSRTGTTNVIKGSGNITLKGVVRDSRGREFQRNVTINVLPYDDPKITVFSLDRVNADGTDNPLGDYVKVRTAGTWASLNAKNNCTVILKSKPRGSTTWETKNTVSVGTSGTTNQELIVGSYSELQSFDFRVEFKDTFKTTIALNVLSTGQVTMSWAKNGIGIGKVHEQGTLDVAGPFFLNGLEQGIVEQDLSGGSTGYVRFANGLQICWLRYVDAGNGGQNYRYTNKPWPAAFYSYPSIHVTAYNNHQGSSEEYGTAYYSAYGDLTWFNVSVKFRSSVPSTASVYTTIFAIGRWK
jgi:hypothetical protein